MAAVGLALPVGGAAFKLLKKAGNVADSLGDLGKAGTKAAKNADAAKGAAKVDGIGCHSPCALKGPKPKYTSASDAHVASGHHNPKVAHKKSQFAPGEGGQKFSNEIYHHPGVVATQKKGGRWEYVVEDTGRVTGDFQGQPLRGGTVVTHADGTVLTQHPGVPWGWKA